MSRESTSRLVEDHPGFEDLPTYESLTIGMDDYRNSVGDDGRFSVDLDTRLARTLSRLITEPAWKDKKKTSSSPLLKGTKPSTPFPKDKPAPSRPSDPEPFRFTFPLKLNILIQVVGSRGDVQPFVALGNRLQKHGHRVRLATHNVFEKFVRDANLEFYPIGGNPSELMSYMVRNPGLIPSMKSLKDGDIQKKRKMVAEMLNGCWSSCIEPDTLTGAPFVPHAIIANPPSFAHVHCAQALGIPVHLMFTMPWSGTSAFPHPLANLKYGKGGMLSKETANLVSYSIVEWMTWQGLGDIINTWRESIDLEEVPLSEGPYLAETQQIPFTYCWSPALVPKPSDWPSYIDVCGFFFREPPNYDPPADLAAFMNSGPMPLYIGFGSIVIDDPERMTRVLVDAVRRTGSRAIISKGWSNLGGIDCDDILFLGDCPHEWLFANVSAVVHHGGAGTTACGLLNGRPTTIVPFFGDQPFWGDMVAAAGAGPKPIPQMQLTAENLADAIRFCLTPEAATAAQGIAAKMSVEDGVETAVRSFHDNLPVDSMRCNILEDRPAVWSYKRGTANLKLSTVAAVALLNHLKISRRSMEMLETRSYVIEARRWDPVTAGSSATLGMYADVAKSAANIVAKPVSTYRQHSKARRLEEDPTSKRDSDAASQMSMMTAEQPRRDLGKQKKPRGCVDTTGAVFSSALLSVADVFKSAGKGIYVDVPLALADGFRMLPRLYGEDVRDRPPIKDWKDGFTVGGLNFVVGISEGLAGLVLLPYKGGEENGVAGAVVGVGKGVVGLLTKTTSSAIGIVAYPGHGMYKSIRSSARVKAKRSIEIARVAEGVHALRSDNVDTRQILMRFDDFVSVMGDQGSFGGYVLDWSARCSARLKRSL